MSPHWIHLHAESLLHRAHDIERSILSFRAELARLPVDEVEDADALLRQVTELGDLLLMVEDLWEAVSGRASEMCEDAADRALRASAGGRSPAQEEKWRRYLVFAAAAGIRLPAPAN
jgi:hypothetical protein